MIDVEEPASDLSDLGHPLLSLRRFGEVQALLATRQAQRMNMNTTDMRALSLLDRHGSLGLSELARHLDLRPASVTSLIDRLEAAGLIERERGSDDRRRITVRALPEARRLSYEVWSPVLRAMDAAGNLLSDEDQRVVCAYLDHVTEIMRASAAG